FLKPSGNNFEKSGIPIRNIVDANLAAHISRSGSTSHLSSCSGRAEPLKRAQALNDAVLVRESEVEFEARAHLFVELEADVSAQVADEFRAWPSELSFVFDGNLFDVCQPFVARAGEVYPAHTLARRLLRHPHRED